MASKVRSWLVPLIFAIGGVAILVALGTWQLQRMEWKQGLIDEIEARLDADPVALPDTVSEGEHHLLRVEATGYLERDEIHVISSIKRVGPGFRVIAPMELAENDQRTGRRIMVDLGFVPERMKSIWDREPSSIRLQKRHPRDRVVGVLYWPDEVDGYPPAPDAEREIWFARDVEAMARQLGTEPVLLVAEEHPDRDWPRPQPPGHDLPNRHLEYALTWYGLAVVWVIMSLIWLRSERRRRNRSQ